jgi:hypothetical protein
MRLLFVRRIHEHETGHALTVVRREDADAETTDRSADKDERPVNAGAADQLGQPARDPPGGAWRWTGIAVTHSGAIVGADPRKAGDVRLDEAPIRAGAAQTGFENDRRPPGSSAPDMQPMPSDVDESSWWWSRRQLSAGGQRLIDGASECPDDE